jgi:hypothetical protein
MSIIITNPNLEYERLNVEIYFSHALNLRSVRFNIHTLFQYELGSACDCIREWSGTNAS